MGVIVSVNVGLPQDVAWQGRTVRTGVWKTPVTGRIFARRLNLDGDGQGDLRGHGGEQRAIMVYQLDSYRYWASYLGRSDLVAGNFGENLTVEGLADNEVCIGDRFRIGGAVVEVSQPRDTCYRVGIRLNHPEIAALLVAHHRPGFYFRVIQEGEIGAGDRVEKLSDGPERMTVAEIDALLYSAEHPLEALRRAVRIPALSLDWQGSMQALLAAAEAGGTTGNAGLGLGASAPLAWRGFRPVVVVASREESADVRSFEFAAEDGSPLPPALPGQYIMVRVRPARMLPPSREAIRCAVRPGAPTIGLASRTSAASQAAFSTKASGQAVAWRSALLAARSRSRPVQLPSSLSAPVSASRRCWRCCMVRLLQTPGRLGRFGGCIQPAIGRTIRLPRRRTICSPRSVRPVAA